MIRIVIAEDQELLLGVIGALLNLEEDIEVVGQATNGQEAIALVHELQPDICIMDIEMPVMNGLDAADALISSDCRIIIMTTFARIGYVERAQESGVRGYLLKDSPSKDLIRSIRSIMNGKQIYSPELIDHDTSEFGEGVETFSEFQNDTCYRPKNPFRNVRKYFSTIIDKMKLPTG
ncbi:response regulator transcription factor [Niallia oryzisoli]|uniref:Response regulator transcription factor n=1 Tax=Niallia oryzisoli TaxID=1737571 RepID=A0ABZ2CKE4_9BACI